MSYAVVLFVDMRQINMQNVFGVFYYVYYTHTIKQTDKQL